MSVRLALAALASTSLASLALLPAAQAQDQERDLHAEIMEQDAALFGAFNSCDGEGFGALVAEDIEFYHDLDGLGTDKAGLIEAVNTSICGNFRRILDADSVEVWPVPGHGAIQSGVHYFINYGADAPHGRGRFLHIWQETPTGWQLRRVVSYDHGPIDAD
tara:strand:- start:136 stop:618 length:483 start_codon:yes stop_codon:yes gene_type:complete